MTCDEVAARLDELVDDSLASGDREGVMDHAAGCPRCQKEIAAAMAVAAATARLPRAISPGRDLWPGIAARLAGGQVAHGTFTPMTKRLGLGWWLGVAAALAGAFGLWSAARSVLPENAVKTAARPAAGGETVVGQAPGAAASAASVAMIGPAAQSYRLARASLQAELASHRGAMAPETRRVVDENLAVIDHAAAAIETALASDPGNRSLEVLLTATRGQEIQLLQQAAALAAGNRQGGQA